jgi:hypothetical protein
VGRSIIQVFAYTLEKAMARLVVVPGEKQSVEFATTEEARAHARALAAELGSNCDAAELAGRYVCVTDERGRELYRTPLINEQSEIARALRERPRKLDS